MISVGISSSLIASGTSSEYGRPQWPCDEASVRAYETPARARRGESLAMPIFWAIVSADRKPMPRMSAANRYGFSLTMSIASGP